MSERGIAKTLRETRDPTTADHNAMPGDIWTNVLDKKAFVMTGKNGLVGVWKQIGASLDYQESVISESTEAAATETEGFRYLASATGTTWVEDYIYEYESGVWESTAPSEGMVVFDEDTAGYLLYSSSAWGSFTTGITTIAAATDTAITTPAVAELLIYDDVTSDWTNIAVSGDVVITKAGVTTVSASSISDGVTLEDGGALQATLVLTEQTVAAGTLTVPDIASVSDTFVLEDLAQTLVAKTIDCASNTVSNINGAELEDAAATTALGMAIPFIIKKDISNALTTTLYSANFPQKARLIKAWVEETATNAGNVAIDDGTNPICAAVSYGGTDTDVTDFPNIDDDYSTLAANATLRCVNSVNTDDSMVYMMFIPIA